MLDPHDLPQATRLEAVNGGSVAGGSPYTAAAADTTADTVTMVGSCRLSETIERVEPVGLGRLGIL